jgi:hypothetical protein
MKRVPPAPEFAVAQAVQRLQERFVYPDDLGGGGPAVLPGGGGAPTVVVAASDASDLSKSKADYWCTGAGDEFTLQGVVDRFATTGCLLILTEGTYNLASSWTISGTTWVRGAGADATFLIGNVALGAVALPGEKGKMSDLFVENQANNANATGVEITGNALLDNLVVFSTGGIGIDIGADQSMVRRCEVGGETHGIYLTSGSHVWIAGNYVESDGVGIQVDGDLAIVIGNHINDAETHGLVVAGADGVYQGNVVNGSGDSSANTFDNYRITGNRNTVIGNTAIAQATTRYGINVVAGATNNVVFANMLGDSSVYATADSVDAGTGTILAAAGGVIGGQFAY